MSEAETIQWFPGHMTRTKRKIEQSLKLVDVVAEIVDARLPLSSQNPDLDKIILNKPRIIILNKCDMADKKATNMWLEYYKSIGKLAIAVDCKSGRGLEKFIPCVKSLLKEKIESAKKKGIINKNIKVMVVGIPNVGKSSFINKMAKGARAKTEDRPGVTRGNQWFTIGQNFDLLDTPGVLWPKFEDKLVGEKLAFCGSVKDEILDTEHLAIRLLDFLKKDFGGNINIRYKLEKVKDELADLSGLDLLKLIGKKRGMLISGGEIDTERAAIMVLDEFRSAKLGSITLENPPKSK
ncbi:MAG: Ribosome biogenesis GTPase A [Eubacteriales bacterium SKADARSKE-1]|nr:Ribosome biogenesis GTPase A [Eubacteriales bacterium SKADARSKE-1]